MTKSNGTIMKNSNPVFPYKGIIVGILLISSVSNASSFMRHAMIIGTGFVIGHAADKAMDYGVERYQASHRNGDHNSTQKSVFH